MGFLAENNSGTVDSLHLVNNLINDCASTVYLQTGVGINYATYINTGQLTSDPLFMTTTNFHLQDGSPAEQSGVHIGSPYLLDYESTPFLNPPSRGAYEVTSGFSIPTLTTVAISSITNTTASSGGTITSDGGAAISARGVCWSTSANPTTANSHTSDGTGTGDFTSAITGLTTSLTYYVRAYATNSAGTAYGNERNFIAEAGEGETIEGSLVKHNGIAVKLGTQLIKNIE
jgi:hypothetical protein